MDPLSSSKSHSALKTPQSFLGENSGLVNLDQLIQAPAPTAQPAAYNPFGDIQQPSKTNLFQQQMQPVSSRASVPPLLRMPLNHPLIVCQVPSINQLKQTPFPVTINQDPWAPSNTNSSNQVSAKRKKKTVFRDQFSSLGRNDLSSPCVNEN